mmetsp:Transcript_7530/g.28286  ORF Transcript_7530/g.28286 Transcript_7530/m.28286 type:complete len:174 (-) Transcript_7530:1449-1970(-)
MTQIVCQVNESRNIFSPETPEQHKRLIATFSQREIFSKSFSAFQHKRYHSENTTQTTLHQDIQPLRLQLKNEKGLTEGGESWDCFGLTKANPLKPQRSQDLHKQQGLGSIIKEKKFLRRDDQMVHTKRTFYNVVVVRANGICACDCSSQCPLKSGCTFLAFHLRCSRPAWQPP